MNPLSIYRDHAVRRDAHLLQMYPLNMQQVVSFLHFKAHVNISIGGNSPGSGKFVVDSYQTITSWDRPVSSGVYAFWLLSRGSLVGPRLAPLDPRTLILGKNADFGLKVRYFTLRIGGKPF
jgi:hypothetical protein